MTLWCRCDSVVLYNNKKSQLRLGREVKNFRPFF